MNGEPWTAEELKLAQALAGKDTFSTIYRAFCHQFPRRRTRSALRNKLLCNQWPCRPTEDSGYVSIKDVRDLLGINRRTVARWLKKEHIASVVRVKKMGSTRYTHRSDWERLARKHPKVFAGIEPDRLFALIEDEELAYSIAESYPRSLCDHRIACVQTGQVWPSAKAASAKLFISDKQIRWSIETGRPIQSIGLTFKRYP